jgi:hypothetical protein
MTMNEKQVQERLRQLGSSGEGPGLSVAGIVTAARARRRRRVIGSGGAALVLLTGPYAVWSATRATVSPVTAAATSRTSGTASGSIPSMPISPAPRPPLAAPACPPGQPDLVQKPSADAPVLSRPVQVAAGHTLTFYAAQRPRNASDRPNLSVQLIVSRPVSEWTAERFLNGLPLRGLADLKKPENQIAVSRVITSPGALETLTVSVPATTVPGRYPVFMVTTWPGPSLCGHTNQDPRTPTGTATGQAATLTVTFEPR